MNPLEINQPAVIGWRKYSIAAFFSIAGTVALFMDKLSGGEYLILIGTVMSVFTAGNLVRGIQK